MSFPGQESKSPWEISEGVNTAGFAQDVVFATSCLLQEIALEERDWIVLTDCKVLLQCVTCSEHSPPQDFGEQHLGPVRNNSLLRVTRSVQLTTEADYEHTTEILDVLLEERERPIRSDERETIEKLRETFLAVGKANLKSMTLPARTREDPGTWMPSITSLPY